MALDARVEWVRIGRGDDPRPPEQTIAEQLRKIGK